LDPFPSLSLSLSLARARVRSGLRSFAVRPPAPSPFFTFHPSPEYTWNIYLFSLAISPIFPNRKISRFPRFPRMPILASFSRVDMTTSRFLSHSRSAGTTSCNPVVYPHYNCRVCRVNVSLGRSHSSCVLMYVLILDAENRPSWVGARRAASFTGKKAEQAVEKRHRRGYRDEEGRQPLVRRGRAFEARGAVPRHTEEKRLDASLAVTAERRIQTKARAWRTKTHEGRCGSVWVWCEALLPSSVRGIARIGRAPASSSSWGVDHGGEQAGSKASADGNRQAGLHH